MEKVPFALLSLTFMAPAGRAKQQARSLASLGGQGPLARIAHACYGARFCLEKAAWPTGITASYPLPVRLEWTAPPFLVSLPFVVGVSTGLVLRRRRWPGLLASGIGVLVILAPTSGLVPIGSVIVADRSSDLARMALVPAAAAGMSRLASTHRRLRRVALGVAGPGLLLGSGVLT